MRERLGNMNKTSAMTRMTRDDTEDEDETNTGGEGLWKLVNTL